MYVHGRFFVSPVKVAYIFLFKLQSIYLCCLFSIRLFSSCAQPHFCHQLVWCQILGFQFPNNAAPHLFETKHFMKSQVTLTSSISCYTSILNFANYSGTCTDELLWMLCFFLVFHFHAIVQQNRSRCLCIIWPTDALVWNQSLYTEYQFCSLRDVAPRQETPIWITALVKNLRGSLRIIQDL